MLPKRKILIICKNLPSQFKGGIQTHTQELAESLSLLGHQVTVLTGRGLWRKNHAEEVHAFKVHELPYLPGRKLPLLGIFLDELFFNISAFIFCCRTISKYDLVHLQGRSGYFCALFLNSPKVLMTSHGLLLKEFPMHKSMGMQQSMKLYYFLALKLEKLVYRRVRHLIAVSHALRNDILANYKPHALISVVPNGISEPVHSTEALIDRKYIAYIGRLDKSKGIEDFIQLIQESSSDVSFLIIGKGEYQFELEQLIANDQTFAKKVLYLSSQTKSQIFDWLQKTKVVVMPSYYETQGIVLLEAQLSQVPIIATKIPGIMEFVEHGFNGLLYEPGEIKQLKWLLAVLNSNKLLAKRIASNGRKLVRDNFMAMGMAIRTDQVYKQLMP